MFKPIIFLCCVSLSFAYHTNGEDISANFFEQLRTAESDVFKWLRDEYRLYLNDDVIPARHKRESGENGEDWYKNFQCRAENKSCESNNSNGSGQNTWQEVSEQQQQVSDVKHSKTQFDGEKKLQASQHERINDKKITDDVMQQQQVLSDFRSRHHQQHEMHAETSNGIDAINRLLDAKTSLAARQNEIHEIELKHKHLNTDDVQPKFSLNENQLLEQQQHDDYLINAPSSNGDFHSFDAQSFNSRGKRSSGHRQTTTPKHYDDQINFKKNNLFDELDDTTILQQEQHTNEPRNRVKRRDAINRINHIDGSPKFIDYASDGKHFTNFLINPTANMQNADSMENNNLLNDKQHVNTSAATTTQATARQQEMNNGNEKFPNDKSDWMQTVAPEDRGKIEKMPTSAVDNAKFMRKRDIQSQRKNEHNHLYAFKGRQKISDLISGELSNEIVKAAHNLINSNDLLRQHIKPHLDEPQYSTLKDPYQLKSNKMNSEMTNLVSYINELVNDQIQMRSCIQLTPELQKFYAELMGKGNENAVDDNAGRNKKSVENYSLTHRKFKRNANHNRHSSKLELEQKCEKVYKIHAECLQIEKCTNVKPSLVVYFKGHEDICEAMKNSYKKNPLMKHKRSLEGADVTPQFAKLFEYKNYFLEANINDF